MAPILKISLEKNRLTNITVHNELYRLSLFHLKSVMLDHFIAKNATAYEVNSYYTLAIFYCTLCVRKHTILGPDESSYTPVLFNVFEDWNEEYVVPHISFDSIHIRFERKQPIRRFLILPYNSLR